jgi:hypothetical protein
VLAVGTAVNERAEDDEAPLVNMRTAAPVAIALPVVVLGFIMSRSMAPAPEGSGPEFRALGDKLRHLLTPFYSFSGRQCAVMAGGYLAALLVFLLAYRRALRPGPLGLSALAFLALYFGFPVAVGGTYDLDVRFLLPALLLPFCAEGAAGEAPGRKWWLLPWAACLLNFAFVIGPVRSIDRELTSYRAALDGLPKGSAVLPLVCDDGRHGRIRPYRYFAHWHLIERQGRVPGTFAGPEFTFYDHFRRTGPPLYQPELDWGTTDFAPLDWEQIAAQYQYVIQAGEGPRAAALIAERARPVARVGDVTVYRVEPATSSAAAVSLATK